MHAKETVQLLREEIMGVVATEQTRLQFGGPSYLVLDAGARVYVKTVRNGNDLKQRSGSVFGRTS